MCICSLWDLCNAEYSHISEACVPLLLHCITLPLGSDVFWRIVQESFHDSDWRIRFTAVERVTVITRYVFCHFYIYISNIKRLKPTDLWTQRLFDQKLVCKQH